MGVFSWLTQKIGGQQPRGNPTEHLSGKTINNYPMEKVDPYALYPWSDMMAEDEVTVGEVIVLWWLSKYWNTNRGAPLYFERNYVASFSDTINSLTKRGFINKNHSLTSLGDKALSDNTKYVALHQQNWTTPEDRRHNNELQRQELANYNAHLRNVGLSDLADENERRQTESERRQKFASIHYEGEKLSKKGNIEQSTEMLLPLLKTDYNLAEVYWRLAINYRKGKNYSDEVWIIQEALVKKDVLYFSFHSVDDFEKRLAAATKSLNRVSCPSPHEKK